jgi:hypothetical protein
MEPRVPETADLSGEDQVAEPDVGIGSAVTDVQQQSSVHTCSMPRQTLPAQYTLCTDFMHAVLVQ